MYSKFDDDDSNVFVDEPYDCIMEFVLELSEDEPVDIFNSLVDVGDVTNVDCNNCGLVYRVMIVVSSFAAAN